MSESMSFQWYSWIRPFVLINQFLGPHLREQQHVLDTGLAGQEHAKPVDAESDAGGGWHTVFQGTKKVVVDKHGFIIATLHQLQLSLEALPLFQRVVELAIGIGDFFPMDDQFKTFYK